MDGKASPRVEAQDADSYDAERHAPTGNSHRCVDAEGGGADEKAERHAMVGNASPRAQVIDADKSGT